MIRNVGQLFFVCRTCGLTVLQIGVWSADRGRPHAHVVVHGDHGHVVVHGRRKGRHRGRQNGHVHWHGGRHRHLGRGGYFHHCLSILKRNQKIAKSLKAQKCRNSFTSRATWNRIGRISQVRLHANTFRQIRKCGNKNHRISEWKNSFSKSNLPLGRKIEASELRVFFFPLLAPEPLSTLALPTS